MAFGDVPLLIHKRTDGIGDGFLGQVDQVIHERSYDVIGW